MNSTDSIPTAIPLPSTWRENAAKKALGLLGLDRVLGAANIQRAHLITERLAKKTQDGTLEEATVEPQDKALESMDIHVGDEIHNHYTGPTTASAVSAPAEPEDTTRDHKPRSSWLLPAALVAGSVFSGGAAGWMLAYQTIKAATQPTPIVQPVPADENTLYELHLSKGE